MCNNHWRVFSMCKSSTSICDPWKKARANDIAGSVRNKKISLLTQPRYHELRTPPRDTLHRGRCSQSHHRTHWQSLSRDTRGRCSPWSSRSNRNRNAFSRVESRFIGLVWCQYFSLLTYPQHRCREWNALQQWPNRCFRWWDTATNVVRISHIPIFIFSLRWSPMAGRSRSGSLTSSTSRFD